MRLSPEVTYIYSKIRGLKTSIKAGEARGSAALPKTLDIREEFTSVMDQGDLGSCTSER
jgi:hypothetical protein